MVRRILIWCLLVTLSAGSNVPEVTSYAKVSWNGQQARNDRGSLSWINRIFAGANSTESVENEGRSIKNIAFTMSPIYVPSKTPRLKNGEAIDYPATPRYSTLDHQMIAKLDAKKQIEQRFHPPVSFDRPNGAASPSINVGSNSDSNSNPPSYASPIFSDSFSYSPPDFLKDKPISKPLGIADYSPSDVKPLDSYKPPADTYSTIQGSLANLPNGPPSYNDDLMSKPDDFPPHDQRHPPFEPDHFEYDHHPEIIYDHLPDFHDHHHFHHHTTTEQPEMNDQRLDKRPYSYYFIGKKLWYIPLYFSIYFIFYIGALVLKSVARHKITFPQHLAEAVGHGRSGGYVDDYSWWNMTSRVLEGVESFADRFGRES